jgi:hypothetical protein
MSASLSGVHIFEIAYGTGGNCEVYQDGTLKQEISSFSWFRFAEIIQVGIENSDTNNFYVNGTYSDSLQFRFSDALNNNTTTWSAWDSATVADANSGASSHGDIAEFFLPSAAGNPGSGSSSVRQTHP